MWHRRLTTLIAGSVIVVAATPASALPGDVNWTRFIEGSAAGYDRGSAVAVSPDGARVFVTGQLVGSTTAEDIVAAAYDSATGARLWLRRYDGPVHGLDSAEDITVDPNGSAVYVSGAVSRTDEIYDMTTIAYSASTGATLWVHTHQEATAGDGEGISVNVLGRRVIVTGWGGGHAVTLALRTHGGSEVWVQRGPAGSYALRGAVSPGRVYVGGGYLPAPGQPEAWVSVYRAFDGKRMWARRYAPTNGGPAYIYDLAASPDGTTLYTTGSFDDAGLHGIGQKVATTAFSVADGSLLWRNYTTPEASGYDEAASIAVATDGSAVFVSMESWDIYSDSAYKTVAYAADGTDFWPAPIREDDVYSESGYPTDIVVSPDGTVFVTGAGSPGVGFGEGALTYAYDTVQGGQALWYSYEGPYAYTTSIALAPDGLAAYLTGSWDQALLTLRFATK